MFISKKIMMQPLVKGNEDLGEDPFEDLCEDLYEDLCEDLYEELCEDLYEDLCEDLYEDPRWLDKCSLIKKKKASPSEEVFFQRLYLFGLGITISLYILHLFDWQ